MEHDPRVGSDADHHCDRMNNEVEGMEHDHLVGSDADHHCDRMNNEVEGMHGARSSGQPDLMQIITVIG
jgi:hypothetical protein